MVVFSCAVLKNKHFLKNHLNGDLKVQNLQRYMNIAELNRVDYPLVKFEI